jgi:8-oxo-dGTP pyrophosphatase MutT (NUDIX family)
VSAAGILFVRSDGAILLARRSPVVTEPGTWGIPGGRLKPGEDVAAGAMREFMEEMGSMPPTRLLAAYDLNIPSGVYTTLVVTGDTRGWAPRLNWEHDQWGWFRASALPRPLHPGVVRVLDAYEG